MANLGNLFVLGSGGHAVAVMDAAQSYGFKIQGFVDSEGPASISGLPVISDVRDTDGSYLALGIGTNFLREKVFQETRALLHYSEFPPIIHSTSFVSPLAIVEEAAVVLAMASVGPQSRVGRGSLLNTGASLDHDSLMDSWSSLGPGARTGGNVSIGQRSVVGLQAGISHGVTVGPDSIVGAHSFANKDLDRNLVAYGIPARMIRSRRIEDPYY